MNGLTYIFVKSVTEENWQLMGKTVITLSPADRKQAGFKTRMHCCVYCRVWRMSTDSIFYSFVCIAENYIFAGVGRSNEAADAFSPEIHFSTIDKTGSESRYLLFISLTVPSYLLVVWLLMLLAWYLVGQLISPGVYPHLS